MDLLATTTMHELILYAGGLLSEDKENAEYDRAIGELVGRAMKIEDTDLVLMLIRSYTLTWELTRPRPKQWPTASRGMRPSLVIMDEVFTEGDS